MPGNDAQLLEDAVRRAGGLALDYYNSCAKAWTKQDGTPVTEADIAVDKLLRDTLCGARPDYGWLSEETADDDRRIACRRVWVVDPIDGTRTFVEHIDQWCVAAALVEDGRPILSCILRPVCGDFYTARSGKGAFLNGTRLAVSDCTSLANARIMARSRALQDDKWQVPLPPVKSQIINSLVLRLCKVADAGADAAIAFGCKSDWDLAPGDLVLSEAGGIATNKTGAPFIYNQRVTRQKGGVIAAGPGTHKLIMGHRAQ